MGNGKSIIVNQEAAEELAALCAELTPARGKAPAYIGAGMLANIIDLANQAIGVIPSCEGCGRALTVEEAAAQTCSDCKAEYQSLHGVSL